MERFQIGEEVVKDTGDYTYSGTVVSVFQKMSGEWRYVVEHNDLHILFIFNSEQLRLHDGTAHAS